MSCNCPKIYTKRDIIAQREYYTKHICHMTYEGLHDKSEIAAELAHRDILIEAADQTAENLRKGIQDFLDGDYLGPSEYVANGAATCPHDKYRWENCPECDEVHFIKVLEGKS